MKDLMVKSTDKLDFENSRWVTDTFTKSFQKSLQHLFLLSLEKLNPKWMFNRRPVKTFLNPRNFLCSTLGNRIHVFRNKS